MNNRWPRPHDGAGVARVDAALEPLEPRRLMSFADADPTFGAGGTVTLPFTPTFVAAQPNGDVIAAMAGTSPDYQGRAHVKVADVAPSGAVRWVADVSEPPLTAFVNGVAIAPDGRVIVGGTLNFGGQEKGSWLARINTDGTVDATFQPPELAAGILADVPRGVGFQPDGKLVVLANDWQSFSLQRLNTSGSLDRSFKTSFQFTPGSFAERGSSAMLLRPDGKVVITGYEDSAKRGRRLAVARFNADGTPDATFGVNGAVRLAALPTAILLRAAANGDVLIAGSDRGVDAPFVAAVTPDGKPDAAFATAGVLASPAGIDTLTDVKAFPDGTFLVAGTAAGVPTVARFTANGQPDTSFGVNGVLRAPAADPALVILSFTPDAKLIEWDGGATVTRLQGASGVEPADTAPPRPTLNKVPKIARGSRDATFAVTYRDDQSGVGTGNVAAASVIVHFGRHRTRTATLVSVVPAAAINGSAVVATYRFRSPTGRWGAGANGAYTLWLAAGGVTDGAGNEVEETLLGTLGVVFPA